MTRVVVAARLASAVVLGGAIVIGGVLGGAVALPSRALADRPDTPGTSEIFRYDASDAVESLVSPGGAFRVHFTRAGANAVPLADADGDGAPDHVESVAEIYDEVLAFYTIELGFRAPLGDGSVSPNGGDALFDVYLLDFGGSADGSFRADGCGIGGASELQCVGFMVQENDFAGYGYPSVRYANRLLASHELFHAVQAAYDSTEDTVLGEGTAVWASEAFDPLLQDLEAFVDGYFERTDRPIDSPLPGPVDPFSYGAGIFFQFLGERFGPEVIRELWEATVDDVWLSALDTVLTTSHASSFEAAFAEFAEWNLFTADRADGTRSYAAGRSYPSVLIETVELPHRADPLPRVFHASARYLSADPGARTEVTAELVGDPAETAGIDLVLVVRRGDALEVASGATADTAGADEIFMVIVRPAIEGESQRPALCVGSEPEVSACRIALTASDAGAVDPDAGVIPVLDAGGTPVPPPSSGCACTVTGAGSPRAGWIALAVVAIAIARRRR